MKRDLKINYGVLDEIIDQLHTYDGALQSMGESLESVSSFVKTNEGQSVEAWNQDLNTSKEDIKKYKEQVSDLLSLFENYVTDTTSHISPVSRGTMMRVSRNNIWANLQQINSGTVGNVSQALLKTYQQPSFISGLFEDPTDTEKDASEHNKRQLDAIKESIQSTQTVLMGKMENLWDLYNQKVKAFENTDDAYKDLALDLKYKYTTFFERAGEGFVAPVKDFYDIGRGFFVEAFHMVSGVALISWDIGIVAVSSQIPDPIEPAFLKNKNDAIIEDYTNAALQLKEDPMMAVELIAQSMSDTVEEEGVMYVSGSALTYLIPSSLFVKFIKEGSAVKGVGKARVNDGKDDKGSKNTIDNIDGIKVIDGKVNGKVPIDNYKQIRIESVHNVDSDSLTLGKYTPTIENGVENWGKAGPDSYIGRAGKDSTYFDLGDHWDKIQKRYDLTDKEMFELFNVPVLDDAVKGGKEIRFSHDPRVDEYKTSYLRKEWEYLQETYNYKTLKNKGDVFIAK